MVTISFPHHATPFVGREDELAEIERLLADLACRLLTLTGPGGIGKTRLAVEAARLQRKVFEDGVHFVALQALTSSDFMVTAIAEAIGFQFYPGGEPKQQILDYLREKSLQLVLDNFEHLLDGAEFVSDILAHAPDVKVLATSRERLNLVEEWVLDVQGLTFPTSEAETEIVNYGAVQLFLQNAGRVHVGFAMGETQKPAVSRICRLVGGMPLGIELASAWVRALPCEEIAAEIGRSLDILSTSARNVPPRHRNMRAALEHSWNLLTNTERDVFKKLSVFRGGFAREAAGYVTDASLSTLSALVDKSLLRVDENGRYEIHDLLRQFGEEWLNQSPEEKGFIQDRHCTYYADFVAQRTEPLKDRRHKEALEQLKLEIENVRQAWRWAVEYQKVAEIGRFLESLSLYYSVLHWTAEAKDVFAQAVERLEANHEDEKIIRAIALAMQGFFSYRLGQFAEAKQMIEQGLATLDPSEPRQDKARGLSHVYLVFVTLALGELETAKFHCRESIAIFTTLDEPFWVATVHYNWGRVAYASGDFREAQNHLQASLDYARESGFNWGIAHVLNEFGAVAEALEEYAEARSFLEEGLHLFRDVGDLWGLANSLLRLGRLAVRFGAFPEAGQYLHEALEVAMSIRTPPVILEVLAEIAVLLSKTGNASRAVELLALVLHHPASFRETRLRSEQYLSQLESLLSPTAASTAATRGKSSHMETVVKAVLADYQQLPTQMTILTDEGSKTVPSITLLSERELEVLRLMADGLSNREIADRLVLAVSTVKWHLNEIYSKLHVTSRTQAIRRAQELNLLT